MQAKSKGKIISFFAGIIFVLLLIYIGARIDPFEEDREWVRRRVAIGMTEEQVIKNFSDRPYKEYKSTNAPKDYYVKGWGYRERDITNKVLIFMFGEPICYVWFDSKGFVEDYCVAGS